MSFRAHIGLGANLEQPAVRLRWALGQLTQLGAIEAQSTFFRSAPMGEGGQPDFCNAVCILRSELAPAELMQRLLAIEQAAGRVRKEKWGPRTLDLDLLHVDGVVSDSVELKLPHPGIAARNFVLVPWAQIAPDLSVPGVGRLADLAAAAGGEGLCAWPDID